MKTFTTFFLLSYVKIMNVSFDILQVNNSYYNMSGVTEDNLYFLYINGSMVYFSHKHFPYAVVALFMMIIFNILPLILLWIYPL